MSSQQLYQVLHDTAIEVIKSNDAVPVENGTPTVNRDRIFAVRTPDFHQTWGPHYFATANNHGSRTTDQFIDHMMVLIPFLENWTIEIMDVFVDVTKFSAVVKTHFHMTPSGPGPKEDRTLLNDIVWFVQMTEDGKKAVSAIEYVDAGSAAAIKEKIMAGRAAAMAS